MVTSDSILFILDMMNETAAMEATTLPTVLLISKNTFMNNFPKGVVVNRVSRKEKLQKKTNKK